MKDDDEDQGQKEEEEREEEKGETIRERKKKKERKKKRKKKKWLLLVYENSSDIQHLQTNRVISKTFTPPIAGDEKDSRARIRRTSLSRRTRGRHGVDDVTLFISVLAPTAKCAHPGIQRNNRQPARIW